MMAAVLLSGCVHSCTHPENVRRRSAADLVALVAALVADLVALEVSPNSDGRCRRCMRLLEASAVRALGLVEASAVRPLGLVEASAVRPLGLVEASAVRVSGANHLRFDLAAKSSLGAAL